MEYILASGSSKLVAIALTYPYQVVRARIQVSLTARTSRGKIARTLIFSSHLPIRTPPLRNYTRISPKPFPERFGKRASVPSIRVWERMPSGFFQEPVQHLWYTRTWYGRSEELPNGSKGNRVVQQDLSLRLEVLGPTQRLSRVNEGCNVVTTFDDDHQKSI